MASQSDYVLLLEAEWDRPEGFMAKLREGVLDRQGFLRTIAILREIETLKLQSLDRRLVSLIWYIPLFMSWQEGRVASVGGAKEREQLVLMSNDVLAILEQILGIP